MRRILLTILLCFNTALYADIEVNFDGVSMPPPPLWSIIYNEGQSPIVTLISPNRRSTINISISDYNGAMLDVAAKTDELLGQLAKTLADIRVEASGKDYIEYRATQNNELYSFYQKHIVIDRRLFIFTYTARIDDYLQSRPIFLELINQFRLLNQR